MSKNNNYEKRKRGFDDDYEYNESTNHKKKGKSFVRTQSKYDRFEEEYGSNNNSSTSKNWKFR